MILLPHGIRNYGLSFKKKEIANRPNLTVIGRLLENSFLRKKNVCTSTNDTILGKLVNKIQRKSGPESAVSKTKKTNIS